MSNTRFRNEIFLSNDCIEESFFGFIVFLIVSDTKQTFWNVVDVNEAQSADQRALIHMLWSPREVNVCLSPIELRLADRQSPIKTRNRLS